MKLKTEIHHIDTPGGKRKVWILRPGNHESLHPGILFIHGGGYLTGGAWMIHFSVFKRIAKTYGAVIIAPEYRLSWTAPYPAALDDCYAALKYLWDHADELGVRRDRIVVGGESAGGGLAAAVTIYARDKGEIPVYYHFPLYPMLDCYDTPSSAHNYGLMWGTRRNHLGWRMYLGPLYGTVPIPPYASPSRLEDFAGMPPAYSYVNQGEPFHDELLAYIQKLKDAGIPASVDVFSGKAHAFDFFPTKNARTAKDKLVRLFGEIEK